MPVLASHKTCTGCSACFSICRMKAIKMTPDAEGFLYPCVDSSVCVECGACEKVCPVLHPFRERIPKNVYAARAVDEIRLNCSSGGIFPLLAGSVIDQGGVVWGCYWEVSENLPVAKHKVIRTKDQIFQFQGSKYVQSDLGDSYKQIREELKKGFKVLFSGTPCQIAGLKHFLGKNYENLYCVEVVCHGVPSPKFFYDYLQEVKSSEDKSKITAVDFRNKQMNKYTWRNFGFVVYGKFLSSGTKKSTVLLSNSASNNPFMKAFLSELCNRQSCHICQSRKLKSGADITIGDFWKLSKYLPEIDDDKGTSLVLLNTEKGIELYETIKNQLVYNIMLTYEIAIDSTRAIVESPIMHPKRMDFFKLYPKKGIKKTVTKILGPSICKRFILLLLDVQYKLKHILVK